MGGFEGAAGFAGRGTPNMEPRILGGLPAGLLLLEIEDARSIFSRTGDDMG